VHDVIDIGAVRAVGLLQDAVRILDRFRGSIGRYAEFCIKIVISTARLCRPNLQRLPGIISAKF
jgi:hypothetical protein